MSIKILFKTFVLCFIFLTLLSCDKSASDWEKTKKANTIESYQDYIAKHNTSKHVAEAKNIIEALVWDAAEKDGSPTSYEKYLLQYPGGNYSGSVKNKLSENSYKNILNKIEEDFVYRLTKSQTSAQVEQLINEYSAYNFVSKGIENLELLLTKEIKTNGLKNRFVIKEIMPEPGISRSSVTIKPQKDGMALYETEFPNDRLVFKRGGSFGIPEPSLFGEDSIHRINGKLTVGIGNYDSIVGEGDKLNRLTFCLLKDSGYVYLRGKGKVISKDGRDIKLGDK